MSLFLCRRRAASFANEPTMREAQGFSCDDLESRPLASSSQIVDRPTRAIVAASSSLRLAAFFSSSISICKSLVSPIKGRSIFSFAATRSALGLNGVGLWFVAPLCSRALYRTYNFKWRQLSSRSPGGRTPRLNTPKRPSSSVRAAVWGL